MSTTDDVTAIQQLLARLNTAVDSGNGEAYAAGFTEDGEAVNGARVTKGREALAALAATVASNVPGIRHWVNNHAIDVDGDRATAYTNWTFVTRDQNDMPVWQMLGHYIDEIVRTPDGWKFRRRVAYRDMPYVSLEGVL